MSQYILTGKGGYNFSTSDVDEKYQFDYWKDLVCNHIMNVDCDYPQNNIPFYGTLRVERYDDITFSEICSLSSRFIRKSQHIQKMGSDFMLLTLRLGSKARKTINAKNLIVSSGDISIYHGAREQSLHVNETIEALIFQIPLHRIAMHIPHPEDFNGAVISGRSELGQLTSNHMLMLASQFSRISAQSQQHVINNFLQLLAICAADKKSSQATQFECAQLSLLMQIKAFISSNIRHHELTPEFIIKKFRISLRYLYYIFHDEDLSPCQFITQQRLNLAKEQLMLHTSTSTRIAEIAFDVGFSNVSHFCKNFKRAFGETPSEFREKVLNSQSCHTET